MNRKDLNPEESPQAAFGAELRRLREARGLKQEELGDLTEYSGGHISAVETGRKGPSLALARAMDRALGVKVFEREWYAMKQSMFLRGFPEYVQHESRATEIRLFTVGIIPGLLQTPEYARVLADSNVYRGTISPKEADERLALLAERQAGLVGSRAPMVIVVLDESCIRRPVGGAKVMAAQLQRLVEFAEAPNSVLQIAPYEIGERRALDLPVYLLTLPDRSAVAYTESQGMGYFDRESTSVHPQVRAYHQLQAEALSQAESVAMIRQVMKGMTHDE
ncbi:helix-turn-helix domain-containing protein [Streptomyces sp. NPDC002454]|uniref:helix-turn-helix domain-containing protein n=1 Tax=unclassified Streptomyces TaxID=2593676 RepID=UPI00332DF72D